MYTMRVFSRMKSKCLKMLRRSFSSKAALDFQYYCDPQNYTELSNNVKMRKGVGDVDAVHAAHQALINNPHDDALSEILYQQVLKLPNKTHPEVKKYKEEPKLLQRVNERRDFGNHKPLELSEITRRLNLMRTDQLGHMCGHKSYYLLGELAELEQALIMYTVTNLLKKGFRLVSVPDILPSHVLSSCGMNVAAERHQIYSLDSAHHGPDLYLSGTAEMSMAGLLEGRTFEEHQLPYRLAAVSRCFRAETSNVIEQRGIYRVHQFTKVEMFSVTTPEQSEEMLEEFLQTEVDLFTPLGIHMQVLDMPAKELGAPAYRKYDIEAWMPGRDSYGEISSCSNCTDYQSRRLHIKYKDNRGQTAFANTLNGTACAVPRMLIALLETQQQSNGKIDIPQVLRPFMSNKQCIGKNKSIPELKIFKLKHK